MRCLRNQVSRPSTTTTAGMVVLAVLVGALATIGPRPEPAGAAGAPTRVITYEVRGLQNQSDLEQFAALAAQTYADPRGWSFGGSVRFVRVPAGGSFTLWLSAPSRVPGFGSPCSSLYSCRQGRNVIINEARWLTGSPAWNAAGGSLPNYRHMVVNHETGHWIGFGHANCGAFGLPAPVMQQQTISLQGCAPNPWPLDSERRVGAARLGVEIRIGVPVGSLGAVRPWWHGVRVGGWALDPDTTAPDVVQVTVDGRPTYLLAARSRPDVAAAFPGYGAAHGFDAVIPASTGSRAVCVTAMNIAGGGGNVLLGCRTVVVGSPFGVVETVRAGPGVVAISGWVIDPSTPAPSAVHVYVGGTGVAVPASGTRADVGAAFPGTGNGHGFSALIPASAGVHRVCVYGINVSGPGVNTALACRSVVVGGSPFGVVDAVVAGPGVISVAGWVIDRDVATPGRVHVYVDGVGSSVAAAGVRASVAAVYPLYGAGHGFSALIPASAGVHRVCVYGINVSGPGVNTALACRSVVVGGSPFGVVDAVVAGPGVISVAGWVIDRDVATPGRVHVYVDGVGSSVAAAGVRASVAAVYPLYGAGHGFSALIPASAGLHRVCVYGINVSGPGVNTALACRSVTVPA